MYVFLIVFSFLLIFAATTSGAALVFTVNNKNRRGYNGFITGFSAGIMLAASVFSLLIPAINKSREAGLYGVLYITAGFVSGGGFISLISRFFPENKAGGEGFNRFNPFKFFLAVTMHNIPEGLAVGFAFGGAKLSGGFAAFMFALGIAIQNIPEGFAVALPFSGVYKKGKAFLFGVLSGAVEPFFAVIGYFLASRLIKFEPLFLSFAAGAMVFVIYSDMLEEGINKTLTAWGITAGFALMMALDIAF